MKTYATFLLCVLLASPAFASSLGCFEPNATVAVSAQFNGSNGATAATSVTARVFDPDDTTAPTATPTMTAVDGTNAVGLFRGSFSVPASPLAGVWSVRYAGTVDGLVVAGTDTLEVRAANQCNVLGVGALQIESQGSYTLQQTLSLLLSYGFGSTNVSGSTATYKSPNGVATRAVGTFGSSGRGVPTLTPSAP